MQPLISVIVPIYNVEKYLSKCVESICQQTYCNLEIILVDDGSPDRCPIICDEYAQKDSRIRVIHKENGGLSSARNAGIDTANGEYLFFVDSDDYISLDMINCLYKRIRKDDSDIALCDLAIVNENGDELLGINTIALKEEVWDEKEFWKQLYGLNYTACVVAWNKLYKADIFQKLRYPDGKIHEDEFVIHEVVSQCKRISVVNKKLYYYLQRGESIVGQSFSIKRMDAIEAYLNRSLYFQATGEQALAELSCVRSVGVFVKAYTELDIQQKEVAVRYKELRKMFKKTYGKLIKTTHSLHFVLNELLFVIGTKLYLVTRGLKQR